ncbi:MAG: hypothetical protein OXN26_07940 [Gammaproteobacteria bacterium]|nr:hypothetical protein [Gammaproteobacteria bacterium]
MDIPALQENGELPPGEHSATVDDVEAVFGSSFSNIAEAESGLPFPEFFQVNREGEPKGIIVIRLGDSE